MSLKILHEVFDVIEDRRDDPKPNSYVSKLMSRGLESIIDKIEEESSELAEAARSGDKSAIIHESADLIFHTLVLLAFKSVSLDGVLKEFKKRRK